MFKLALSFAHARDPHFSSIVICHRRAIFSRKHTSIGWHRPWRFDIAPRDNPQFEGMKNDPSKSNLKRVLENADPEPTKSKHIRLIPEGNPHPSELELSSVTDGGAPLLELLGESASPPNEAITSGTSGESQNTGDTILCEGKGYQMAEKAEASHLKKKRNEKTNKSGRRGRRGTRNEPTEREQGNLQDRPKAPRLPKRQCALLLGFCGSGYSGMQIQPDHNRTIEGVLFQAMVRAGAVSQDNADNPVKIGLARAARTDAGVHAAGNLVSLKMITTIPDVPDIVARINEELPPEIRLWGYTRVQNSFNARLVCDSRKYTYFFPSYVLIPPKPGSGLERTLRQYVTGTSLESHPSRVDAALTPGSFWEQHPSLTKEEELIQKRAWRVGSGHVESLRAISRKFEGTHNFHNFTVARDFSDRSNQRHMKKIEVAEPVVYGGTEWISVLFHGQSFMLHQRKMMAAMVLTCRTATPEQVIDEMYGPRVVFIPKMPSLGLLLEEPIFDSYNTRMAIINEKLQPSDPNYRPPISFDNHHDAINAFKQKYIYDNMREVEDQSGLFDSWIRGVDSYAGNDFLYLNPKGAIPPAAIIKKGVRRENPFREKKKFDVTSFAKDDDAEQSVDGDDDGVLIVKENIADTEG